MRKRPIMMFGVTMLILTGLGGVVVAALKHEPGFYQRCTIGPGDQRKHQSDEFFQQFAKLINRVIDGRGKWAFTFSEEQFNSYFEEDFIRLKDAEALAKLGVHAPRVHFGQDTMRVAF